mmetsp:Transcript_90707/g.293626  ORF Transcript_90707/g.293626 Transcript_90707/m.293626 type:complete len:128 (+) Transcript_90707:96-479(+)
MCAANGTTIWLDNYGAQVSIYGPGARSGRQGDKIMAYWDHGHGEAAGYLVHAGGTGWTAHGTYSDSTGTGKFKWTLCVERDRIDGYCEQMDEGGCHGCVGGGGWHQRRWILVPLGHRRGCHLGCTIS